jgi:hypothetical protein
LTAEDSAPRFAALTAERDRLAAQLVALRCENEALLLQAEALDVTVAEHCALSTQVARVREWFQNHHLAIKPEHRAGILRALDGDAKEELNALGNPHGTKEA